MGTASAPVAGTRRIPGKPYLWTGIGLVLLGPAIYVVQLRAKILSVPWYVPALATAGLALVLVSVLQRSTAWRIGVLALCGLLTAAEWYFLLSFSKVPAYAGPVAVGASFPAFSTSLADGSILDQDSLRGEHNTALVFFRGRW
jgi:hypothetical protein